MRMSVENEASENELSTVIPPYESHGIKLIIENRTEAQEPSVMLRWCVQPEIVEELKRRKIADPYLLIYIKECETGRARTILVPLLQLAQLVHFYIAGDHKVYARIVWPYKDKSNDDRGVVKEGFSHRFRGSIDFRWQEGANNVYMAVDTKETIGYDHTDIRVAGGFFAKEPAAWEKWWVELWHHENSSRDICHFRKRRLLAYSLQPPLVFLWIVFITCIRILIAGYHLSMCHRGIRFKAIFRPFKYKTKHVNQDALELGWANRWEHNFLTCTIGSTPNRKWPETRKYACIWKWWKPALIFLSACVIFILHTTLHVTYRGRAEYIADLPTNLQIAFGTSILVSFGLSLLNGLILLFKKHLAPRISKNWAKKIEERSKIRQELAGGRLQQRTEERLATFNRQLDEEYSSLVCRGTEPLRPVELNIFAHPKRTAVLLYQKVKFAYCKPFAK